MLTVQELRTSSAKELASELKKAQKELQSTRINVKTKNQKDASLVSKQKAYVARIKTIAREIALEEMVANANKVD